LLFCLFLFFSTYVFIPELLTMKKLMISWVQPCGFKSIVMPCFCVQGIVLKCSSMRDWTLPQYLPTDWSVVKSVCGAVQMLLVFRQWL
jgi:hypothetical protein